MSLRIEAKYVKIWEIKDTEYGKRVRLSTSRKDKRDDSYISSNWINVKFVGEAKEFLENCSEGDTINILSGQLENVWSKEKKQAYFNMTVFEAELVSSEKENVEKNEYEIDEDDEFPFR